MTSFQLHALRRILDGVPSMAETQYDWRLERVLKPWIYRILTDTSQSSAYKSTGIGSSVPLFVGLTYDQGSVHSQADAPSGRPITTAYLAGTAIHASRLLDHRI
ncbi:hypothetical protein GJ744_011490 [Endocarpon pusillum]|uniref:Uncharacterized protein n=1 Tax=Endocarpon pusillum TaxID=364733 RepID=A0A8H7AGJ7_9EURO|nr:hypothetical protein GJ744_011490 [Endocarpon pusillum]